MAVAGRSRSATCSCAVVPSSRPRSCSARGLPAGSGDRWPSIRRSSSRRASPTSSMCPTMSPVHQVKEFAPDLSFGGSASQPGLVALALSDQWRTFATAITDWRRISVYYAAITSEGRGRVRARARVCAIRSSPIGLTRRDRALLGSGLARLALLMLEAGAQEVYPSFRGAPARAQPRRSGDDARSASRRPGPAS